MRTTLDIDVDLIEGVVALTGLHNKGKAVNSALQNYVRQTRIKKLLELQGNLDLDLGDWYELRHSVHR